VSALKVLLGQRSYPILIGNNLIARLGDECRRLELGPRYALLTDTNVARRFASAAVASLEKAGFVGAVMAFPPGETAKSLDTVQRCYGHAAEHRLERGSFIVALGGGVVGDVAGFVAATYLRGIPFLQVPTTLLAQVDSSVGGKVGVNIPAGKNLVGAFHQPRLVLCDLDTLRALPARQFRAGLAEVIKYGIIYDPALFELLERELPKLLKLDPELLQVVVERCCAIKAKIVGQDETEAGLRKILNFGHTIGHAIEAVSGYGKYLHGEAISIGQVVAANLSTKLAGLPASDVERIRKLFAAAGLPTSIQLRGPRRARLLAALRLDKKVEAGEIQFVLAENIGKVRWGVKVPPATIERALDESALRAPPLATAYGRR